MDNVSEVVRRYLPKRLLFVFLQIVNVASFIIAFAILSTFTIFRGPVKYRDIETKL